MSSQCPVNSYYGRCVYKECKNGKSHGKRLFRFPKQEDVRCNMWIHNTGRSLCNNYVIILYIDMLAMENPSMCYVYRVSHVKCPTESISRTSTNWTKKSYMILQAITATRR